MVDHEAQSNSGISADPFSRETQVNVLLAEYNRLSAETKMYIEQFSPKFTLFAALVLSAFAFAFQHAEYQIVYAIIPLFIFLLGYVQIAQVHIITALAGRIRNIEKAIAELNGGRLLLQWESKVALKLIYPSFISVKLKGSGRTGLKMPNPIFMSVVFVIIALLPLLVYSTWKAYVYLHHISRTGALAYTVFVTAAFSGISLQAFSFFRFGRVSDQIDFDV